MKTFTPQEADADYFGVLKAAAEDEEGLVAIVGDQGPMYIKCTSIDPVNKRCDDDQSNL
jgi:hypothetical protein